MCVYFFFRLGVALLVILLKSLTLHSRKRICHVLSLQVRAGTMGGHVEGSPFLVKAYSAARVAVTDIAPGVVGRPVSFTINASHAGKYYSFCFMDSVANK